jgi:formylglycine-generating enzyme required for sulfatase activity
MNLTSQYIANPKSRVAYIESLATYKSIRTTSTRLSLSDERYVLVPNSNSYFKIDDIYFKMIQCPRGKFKMRQDEANLTIIESPFLLGETEVTQDLFQAVMHYNPSYYTEQEEGYQKCPVEYLTWYEALMFCNKLSKKLGKRPYYNITEIVHKVHKQTIRMRDGTFFTSEDDPDDATPIDEYNDRNRILDLKFYSRILDDDYHIQEFLVPIEEIEENKEYECEGVLRDIISANVTINPNSNGFRLPLEKEWIYAAKAGTNNEYAGTNNKNQVKEVAWFKDNSDGQTHYVKGKRPNGWGFYDMSGNVSEMCWDEDNPKDSRHPQVRRAHGGDFSCSETFLKSSKLHLFETSLRAKNLGFRITL